MKRPDPKRDPAGWLAYWQTCIADAQLETHADIGGRLYPRRPYGTEYPDRMSASDYKPQCRDCGAAIGQLHVEGCCVERCPRCAGQNYGCPCYADDAPAGPGDVVH